MAKKIKKKIYISVGPKKQGYWVNENNLSKGERVIKSKGDKALVRRNRSEYDYSRTITQFELTLNELKKQFQQRSNRAQKSDLRTTSKNTSTAPALTTKEFFNFRKADIQGIDTKPTSTIPKPKPKPIPISKPITKPIVKPKPSPQPKQPTDLSRDDLKYQEKYEKARVSDVGNIGEDIFWSRRESWWTKFESVGDALENAEKKGVAFKLITKDTVYPKIDIDELRSNGKPAGYIFYTDFLRKSLGTKPPDTPEHRKYYVDELEKIKSIIDKSNTFDELENNLMSYRSSVNYFSEGTKIKTVFGKRFYNALFFQGDTTWKKRSMASRLENITPPILDEAGVIVGYDSTRTVKGKSDEEAWKKLDELLAGKTRKASESMVTDEYKIWLDRKKEYYDENNSEERFDFKSGKEATTQLYEDYKLRGVQYGNYVQDNEREKFAELSYGALHDLSKAVKMNKKEISANGKLALAIGARGKGKEKAHYEPSLKVINLTKGSGNGSIAHEWIHFVDNTLYKNSENYDPSVKRPLASDFKITGLRNWKGKEAKDFIAKFNQINDYIHESDFGSRSATKTDYYHRAHEMLARAFQSYIDDKTNNPFLSVSEKQAGDGKNVELKSATAYFPQGNDRDALNSMFDDLFTLAKGNWNNIFDSTKSTEKSFVRTIKRSKPKIKTEHKKQKEIDKQTGSTPSHLETISKDQTKTDKYKKMLTEYKSKVKTLPTIVADEKAMIHKLKQKQLSGSVVSSEEIKDLLNLRDAVKELGVIEIRIARAEERPITISDNDLTKEFQEELVVQELLLGSRNKRLKNLIKTSEEPQHNLASLVVRNEKEVAMLKRRIAGHKEMIESKKREELEHKKKITDEKATDYSVLTWKQLNHRYGRFMKRLYDQQLVVGRAKYVIGKGQTEDPKLLSKYAEDLEKGNAEIEHITTQAKKIESFMAKRDKGVKPKSPAKKTTTSKPKPKKKKEEFIFEL